MGKVLGNYIHHSWGNYISAGTYRVESWSEKQTRNDFDASIFKNYARVLKTHAAHNTININSNKLKQLEKQINNARKSKFDALQNLSNQDKQHLFALVIANANLGDDIDASMLAAYLDFDPKTESITLKTKLVSNGSGSLSLLKSGQYYATAQGVRTRFVTAQKLINTIEDIGIRQPLQERLSNLQSSFEAYVQNHNNNVKASKEVWGSLKARDAENTINAIPHHVADFIVRELQDILAIQTLGNKLAKLKGSFAEIMGALAGNKALEVATNTLNQELPLMLKGLDTSTPGDLSHVTAFKLHGSIIEPLSAPTKRALIIEEHDDKGDWFRFKTDYDTQNKIDFVFEYNSELVGASMKAYDMSTTTGPHMHHQAISLQKGTSLYMYLATMQARQWMPNIGNHFLNVFAHSENQILTSQLRHDANQALALTLLYDGLTGAVIKQGALAQILMIEDTARSLKQGYSRVRLYSIPQLLQEAFQNLDTYDSLNYMLQITPYIPSITLTNEYIGEATTDPKERADNINRRISKILMDARKTQMEVYIKKEFLNNIYKNRLNLT